MILIFGSPSDNYGYRQNLLFVLLLLPVLAGATYLLLYYLVPRYLLKRRFFLFSLYSTYLFIAAAWVQMAIVLALFMLVYQYQIEQINPRTTDLGYLAGAMFLAILPAIAIETSRQWYREREVNDRLKQEKLELELFAREKELDYLKEQMRPHFLFNVLNTLYGLTLEKSERAPELVLKVSEMLDYMLYRSSTDLVSLSDELDHIDTYIDIQSTRFGDRLKLKRDIDSNIGDYRLAPMILLPFIENCFKHGLSVSAAVNTIDIHLGIQNETLSFTVVNSPVSVSGGTGLEKPETFNLRPGNVAGPPADGGLGLKNVVKRLDLLYGDNYHLSTTQSDNRFIVELTVPVLGGNS